MLPHTALDGHLSNNISYIRMSVAPMMDLTD
jgi:hypothetical protein